MKILIAEDEISTAKALKLLLEKEKNSVDIVHRPCPATICRSTRGCPDRPTIRLSKRTP